MKKVFILLFLIGMILLLGGCAPNIDVQECVTTQLYTHTYGFWGGLWHGFIAFFSFIGSLFSDDIAIFAVNNNGGWYNFGFVLGAGILLGGGSKAS